MNLAYTHTVMARPGRKKSRSRKLSLMVLHRVKDTMALVDSITAHKGQLAATLAERYVPKLEEGETLPDYVLTLELAAREVKAALKHLLASDDAVDRASVKRDLKRRECNALATGELQPRAMSVRGAIDQAFGREVGRDLHGMKGQTRRRSPLLLKQLRRLVLLLEDTDVELPPPKNPHAYVDRPRWAQQLVKPYHTLSQLNREVERLRDHVVPGLILDKHTAMDAFDAIYADGLRLVTTHFRAVRFDLKLIKNLKPYYRRRRLSRRAGSKREARAAARGEAAAAETTAIETTEEAWPPERETEQVAVSQTVMRWLKKNRLFGT